MEKVNTLKVGASRKLNFELYAGIQDMDKAIIPAMHVWNSFWGPLGKSHITKKTLLNNTDLVFSLIEASVPSLISKCIEMEDECAELESEIAVMNSEQLTMLSAITRLPSVASVCTELSYDAEQEDTIDNGSASHIVPKDDTALVKSSQELPKWQLEVRIGNDVFLQVITHIEYCKYFSHVRCETVDEENSEDAED